jgi:hypothetical protein
MTINAELLQAALSGYQAEYTRIEQAMEEIRRELGSSTATASKPAEDGKRTMSSAARKRIAAAQKKRWAEYHRSKEAPAKKRKLSAAGRQRIIEATKKRWAAVRAQKAAQ